MLSHAGSDPDNLFEPVLEYPNDNAKRRFGNLVGLDAVKDRLTKEAAIRLAPDKLHEWSRAHHGEMLPAATALLDRPPVFILAGDVGTGKTALAEAVGDPIARAIGVPVFTYRLSLAARGTGLVGEITTLVRAAFTTVAAEAKQALKTGRVRSAFILVIDEADALAQSRESGQMHHEDRAGVNALIRGIDDITHDRLPIVVILCTNRLDAIDPAVQRRSAEPFIFSRPDDAQREALLRTITLGTNTTPTDIAELVKLTGPNGESPGYTYSDLTQRLVPTAVLGVFPHQPLTGASLISAARITRATPPFRASGW